MNRRCFEASESRRNNYATGGLNCPQDVSFLSGAETTLAQWHQPPLTTFDHDCYLLGKTNVDLLVRIIEGTLSAVEAAEYADGVQINRKIIERDSIGNLESL